MGQQSFTKKKAQKNKTRKRAREGRRWKTVKEVISNHSGFIMM